MFKINNKNLQIQVRRWRYIVAAVIPILLISMMLGYLLLNIRSEIKTFSAAKISVSNMADLHKIIIDLQMIRGMGQFSKSTDKSTLNNEDFIQLHKAIIDIQLKRGVDKPVPATGNIPERIMRLRGNVLTSMDALTHVPTNLDEHTFHDIASIKQEILNLFDKDYTNKTIFNRFEQYTKAIRHLQVEILAESRYLYYLIWNNNKNLMYIMELFQLDIPNLIEAIGKVRGYGSTLLNNQNITPDKVRKWSELIGGLRESLERVETKLKVYEMTVSENNLSSNKNIIIALDQINNFKQHTKTLIVKERNTDSVQLYFDRGTLAIEHGLLIYDVIQNNILTSLVSQQKNLKKKFAGLSLMSAVVVFLLMYFTTSFYRVNSNAFKEVKKVNDELSRNSTRLSRIINMLPLMVVVRDAFGKILLENRAYKDVVYSDDDNRYNNQSNMIVEKLFSEDNKLLNTEESTNKNECEFIDKNGNKHVMQLSKILYETDNNGVDAILTVALDITDSKRIQSLQNVAGVGYWEWHAETDKFYMSDEFCSTIGWNKSDCNTDIDSLLQVIVDEDRQLLLDVLEQKDDSLDGCDIELRLKLENKKIRYVRIHGHRYKRTSDNSQIIVGAIQDISVEVAATRSLRSSEQKYRLLVERLREEYFFYSRDASGSITYVSSSIHNVLGYSPDDTLNLTYLSEKMSDRKYNINSYDFESSDNGEPYEITVTDTFGVEHFIKLSEVPIFDDTGKVSIIEGIAYDITKQKKTEENLRLSEEKLRKLALHLQNTREEERVNISRDIHDEVGGMLAALKMDVNLIFTKLKKYDVDSAIHERLEKTNHHIDILIQTVRRIISNLRPSVIDNLGLLEAIEWQLYETRNHFGIEYNYDCLIDNKQLKFNDKGDAVLNIFRIFQELTTNIARHSHASLVTVMVTIINDVFVLSVSDNGCGIDEEQLSKTDSFGIIGIQERVRSLNGDFIVVSKKDVEASFKNEVGTTIIVTVPLTELEM